MSAVSPWRVNDPSLTKQIQKVSASSPAIPAHWVRDWGHTLLQDIEILERFARSWETHEACSEDPVFLPLFKGLKTLAQDFRDTASDLMIHADAAEDAETEPAEAPPYSAVTNSPTAKAEAAK